MSIPIATTSSFAGIPARRASKTTLRPAIESTWTFSRSSLRIGREFALAPESDRGPDLESDLESLLVSDLESRLVSDLESRLESGREPDLVVGREPVREVGREPVRASDCDSGRVLPEVRSSFLFEELAFAAL